MQETTHEQAAKKIYGPKLFVGRIGPKTTPASMRQYFEQICSVQVVKIEFSRKSKNRKGFGYIIVESEKDVTKVLETNHVLDGKAVYVQRYGIEATSTWYGNKENSIKIRVSNVPKGITEDIISRLFEGYGIVMVANILEPKPVFNNQSSRYALIEMLNTGESFTVGNRSIRCRPHEIQCIEYVDISMYVKRLIALASISSESNDTENHQENFDKHKERVLKPILEFGVSRQDKHSKYEYLRKTELQVQDKNNYRFNIMRKNNLRRQVSIRVGTRSQGVSTHELQAHLWSWST